MAQEARSRATEAAGLGVAAGIVFAIVEIIAASAMGMPALMPLRMFASIVLGRSALSGSLGIAVVVGIVVHLVLSAIFGAIYGALNARVAPERRGRVAEQATVGVLYGTVLWLLNFQIIARVAYPWFLDTPQGLQWMMHALFFGLPLGVMYAGIGRRIRVG